MSRTPLFIAALALVGCLPPLSKQTEDGADSGSAADEDDDGAGAGTGGDDGSGTGSDDGSGTGGDDGSGTGGDDGSGTGGGTGSDGDGGDEGGGTGGSEIGPDYGQAGSLSVTTSTGSASIGGGCTLDYTTFTPTSGALGVRVVMAHGFGGQREMRLDAFAEHFALASSGLERPIRDSRAPGGPCGLQRWAARARAAFSGPEVANVGRCSVFRGRHGRVKRRSARAGSKRLWGNLDFLIDTRIYFKRI